MRVELTAKAEKALARLPREVRTRITTLLDGRLTEATRLEDVPNCRKLAGQDDRYRLRLGSYRIGLRLVGELVVVERIGSRGDFYRGYP